MSQQPVNYNPEPQDQEPIDLSMGSGPEPAESFEDYFSGFGRSEKYILPDGVQYIEFQLMNEGQKAKYQRETRSAINIDRKTDQASVMPDPSRERHALIEYSVCDWLLYSKSKQTGDKVSVMFNKANLKAFLANANPAIIEGLEEAIRKANPWMIDDISAEELDKQIEELTELRDRKRNLEAEKSNS